MGDPSGSRFGYNAPCRLGQTIRLHDSWPLSVTALTAKAQDCPSNFTAAASSGDYVFYFGSSSESSCCEANSLASSCGIQTVWCADPNADPSATGDFVPYASCQDGSSILVGYGGNSTFSCEDSISLYVDKAQAASVAGSSCDASVLLTRREALSKCGPVSFACGVAATSVGDVCKDAAESADRCRSGPPRTATPSRAGGCGDGSARTPCPMPKTDSPFCVSHCRCAAAFSKNHEGARGIGKQRTLGAGAQGSSSPVSGSSIFPSACLALVATAVGGALSAIIAPPALCSVLLLRRSAAFSASPPGRRLVVARKAALPSRESAAVRRAVSEGNIAGRRKLEGGFSWENCGSFRRTTRNHQIPRHLCGLAITISVCSGTY